MEKRQGALYFDREEERYNIRFGLEECYHGLYCGEGLEVLVGKRWVRTRIEKAADWYLVGIDTDWLDGLRVSVLVSLLFASVDGKITGNRESIEREGMTTVRKGLNRWEDS